MLALYVDFNSRERYADGSQAVVLKTDGMNPPALEDKFSVGRPVTVYDEEISCQAVIRRNRGGDGWVADLVPGSTKDLSSGDFNRLRIATRRATIQATS